MCVYKQSKTKNQNPLVLIVEVYAQGSF